MRIRSDSMSESIEHKCPSCGASLQFDVSSQMVKCPYCDCEFSVEAMMANEGDLTVDAVDLANDAGMDWSEAELYGMTEYQCQSCGGAIYSDETTSATLCPYCGNAVILKGRLSGTLKPDKVIPFQKSKEQALEGLNKYFGGKRFVNKNFLQSYKIDEVKGLYVPFWVYDAELDGHVEYQGVNEKTWTVGDTEYTERKYYRVIREGDIAFDHVPADGSSKMPDDLMESIEPFDYDKAVDFTTGYLTGFVADKYDVDQDAVRPRIRKRMEEGTADQFRTTVHYDEVYTQGTTISAKKSEVNYVLYPVWMFSTQWQDKILSFAMNGQTGKMVGNLPADMLKLVSATLGIFIGLGLLFTVGAYFVFEEFDIGVAIGAFILSGIIAAAFYAYFKGQLRTVEFQHGAHEYYRPNSMNLRVKEDQFLYKRTSTRRINHN